MNGEANHPRANHWLADLPLTLTKIYEGSIVDLQRPGQVAWVL
jgi:hypothetical protein